MLEPEIGALVHRALGALGPFDPVFRTRDMASYLHEDMPPDILEAMNLKQRVLDNVPGGPVGQRVTDARTPCPGRAPWHRKESYMRRATQVATIGFAGMIVFEAALAAGARLGDAAWGGAHAQLTTGQRFGSAVSVLFYAAAIIIVRRRAAGRAERRYRWGAWALAVIFALTALMNLARAPTGHRERTPEAPPATVARA